MAVRDPYEVLGVPRDAGADEIKSAFRRMARRFHPDVNPNDPEAESRFNEINEAYSILSDPERKARYDQFGTVDAGAETFFGGSGGFSDLFEMFFGGVAGAGRGRGFARDGKDLRFDLHLSLTEVLHGTEREIQVDRQEACDACDGLGTEGGKPPEPCGTCHGQGMVSTVRNTFIGQVRTSAPCPTCGGAGAVVKDRCGACGGTGLRPAKARLNVKVPPGVETGAVIQFPGQGSDGVAGGRPGDLYVVIGVEEHERLERQGQQLHAWVDLTFAQAVLGDQLELEGIEERHALNVPGGTQPGTQIVIKGAGLPPLHGGRRGDLIVHVNVRIPESVSESEANLIRELAEMRGERIPEGGGKGGLFGGLFGKKG
jgi:molecular chaperone DnaJ